MNTEGLRFEVRELLAEVRSAGRGAFESTFDGILDRRLPALLLAHDPQSAATMSVEFRQRLRDAASATCAQVREEVPGSSAPFPGAVWPWQSPWRRSIAWGFATVLVLLLGLAIYNRLAPKREMLVPREIPGVTGPLAPEPRPPTSKPQGPAVQKNPDIRIESAPVPRQRSRERERFAMRDRPVVGELGKLSGDPVVQRADGTFMDPRVGGKLALGSTIDTGDTGRVEVLLKDGSTLVLNFNTVLVLRGESGREFELTSGSLDASVAPTENLDTFLVETPVATAEALGTEFSLALEHKDKLQAVLQVKSGRVAFYNEFDRRIVGALMESTAVQGSKPTEPKRVNFLKSFLTHRGGERSIMAVSPARLSYTDAVKRYVFPHVWTGLTARRVTGGDLRVVDVFEDSPAREAGIMVGDVLLALDDRPLRNVEPILRAAYKGAGHVMKLTIRRDGASVETFVRGSALDPPLPPLPPVLSDRLFAAILPAITGHSGASLQPLQLLVENTGHPAAYNNLGVTYEVLGKMGSAIRNYQMAVQRDPTSAIYRRNLGRALQAIGNNRRCVEELEAAVALEPDYHDALLDLAGAYHVEGRDVEARALLDSAHARYPNCPHFLIERCKLNRDSGKHEEAVKDAEEAIRVAPDYAGAHYQLGVVLDLMRQPSRQEAAFRKAIELVPGQQNFHRSLGLFLHGIGPPRWQEAEQQYRIAIELDPSEPLAYADLGRLYKDQRLFDKAEPPLRKSISLDPDFPRVYLTLAIVLERTGRLGEAEAEMRKVVKRHPQYAPAHGQFARMLELSGKLKEAEVELRLCIELDPLDATNYSNYANFLMKLGRYAEAEPLARKASGMNPRLFSSRVIHGFVLDKLNRLNEAEEEFRKAVELNPRASDAHCRLGQVLRRLNRLQDAEPFFRKAFALDSNHWDALEFLGLTLYDLKRFTEAEEAWRKVLEIAPTKASAHLHLGEALEALGKISEAEGAYRKAIECEPRNAQWHDSLAHFLDRTGRFEEAAASFREAAEADPANAHQRAEFAWSLAIIHRWNESIAAYRKCLEIEPNGPATQEALYNLAYALIKTGDLEEPDKLTERAIKRQPDDHASSACRAFLLATKGQSLDEALDRAKKGAAQQGADAWYFEILGFVHFKRGEYDQAIDALATAAQGWGKIYLAADVQVLLGKVHEARKDILAALDAYRRALQIEPANKPAAEALKRLGGS